MYPPFLIKLYYTQFRLKFTHGASTAWQPRIPDIVYSLFSSLPIPATHSTCDITLVLYNLTNSTSAGANTYVLSPIETKVSGSIDDLLSIVVKMQNAYEE